MGYTYIYWKRRVDNSMKIKYYLNIEYFDVRNTFWKERDYGSFDNHGNYGFDSKSLSNSIYGLR